MYAVGLDKFGTSFNVDYEVIEDQDWVKHTYIDKKVLAQRFFAPVQEQLYRDSAQAVEYAGEQAEKIKRVFSNKFDELDAVIML